MRRILLSFSTALCICIWSSPGSAVPEAAKTSKGAVQVLELDAVLDMANTRSLNRSQIDLELEKAGAEQLSSQGAFDPMLRGEGAIAPLGKDMETMAGVSVEQRVGLLWGSRIEAGYRNSTASRAYQGKDTTSEWGEFYGGLRVPLLKDGYIDPVRALAETNMISNEAAAFARENAALQFLMRVTEKYLKWKASYFDREVSTWILSTATEREGMIQEQVKAGLRAQVALWDNARIVHEREAARERGHGTFEVARLDLAQSVSGNDDDFARVESGIPSRMFRSEDSLRPGPTGIDFDIEHMRTDWKKLCIELPQVTADALDSAENHPMLVEQRRLLKAERVNAKVADNGLLPKLDLKAGVSQDIGESRPYGTTYTSKNETEATIGLSFSFPLLNRKYRGARQKARLRVQSAELKLAQKRMKIRALMKMESRRLARNCAATEKEYQAAVQASRVADAAAIRYREGGIDLLALNLREVQLANSIRKLGASTIKTEASYMMLYWLSAPDTSSM